jgi:Domain of unknown function (DUF4919)
MLDWFARWANAGWGAIMGTKTGKFLALGLAGALFAAAGPAIAADDALKAEAAKKRERFQEIVAQIKDGKLDVDYTELRLDYPFTKGYDPEGIDVDAFGDMWKAFKAKDCDTALAKSEEILASNFIQAVTHYVRGDCFAAKGDMAKSQAEHAIANGILDSFFSSGDGLTIATAYTAVTLDEEHSALAMDKLVEVSQALLSNNGHSYDALGAKPEGGGAIVTRYFKIDEMMIGESLIFLASNQHGRSIPAFAGQGYALDKFREMLKP